VDHQEEDQGLLQNGGFETGDFTYWTGWGGNPREVVSDQAYSGSYAAHIVGPGAPEYVVNLRAYVTYTLSCYGKVAEGSGPILFGIKDPSENVLGSVQVFETSYTKKSIQFTTGSSGVSLKFYFYAPGANVEGWADDFQLIMNDPSDTLVAEEVQAFEEDVFFDEKPGVLPAFTDLSIRLGYQDNGDRRIHLKLFDPDSSLVGEELFHAYAGYGIKTVTLALDSVPRAGIGYSLVAELFHPDSLSAEPISRDVLSLELQDPVDVSIRVLDVRENRAIEGATVRINGMEAGTDVTGSAEFRDVAPGRISVRVNKKGFEDLVLEEFELFRDTLLEVHMQPETRTILLNVRDSYTGSPVTGVSLRMENQSETTDHNGSAQFFLYEGDFTVFAEADRYYPDTFQVRVASDTTLALELGRSLADLKFVVKHEGTYLNQALITLAGAEEYTSSIGIAYFSDLKTDSLHTYIIEHPDMELYTDSITLQTDSTLRLNLGVTGIHPNPRAVRGIYPNPAGERLHVTGMDPESSYRITSAAGLVVLQGVLCNEDTIDISGLEEGVYFITLNDGMPLKFIKQ
jgi:hypothetical protein